MNNKIKDDRGITLTILVVIIVLLLILAGVSIASISGEQGIVNNTKLAAESAKIADIEKRLNLELIQFESENIMGNTTIEKYLERLKKQQIIEENNIQEVEQGNYQIVVDGEYVFLIYFNSIKEIQIKYVENRN